MSKVVERVAHRDMAHIVQHDNGDYYYIDSTDAFDTGYETMVFYCIKEEDENGLWFDIDFAGVHTKLHRRYTSMEKYHFWLIKHLEKVDLE